MDATDSQKIAGAASELSRILGGIDRLEPLLLEAASRIERAIRQGGKLMLFGNGGSSSQAQHIASEFVNRFMKDRVALPALALTTDQSILTSVSNDTSYESVFSRQVEALGKPGDVVIGLSTSGNSGNVRVAFTTARSLRISTIGLTGRGGGELARCSDLLIAVDSTTTPRIQEVHLLLGHLLAEIVESRF